jgi:hypothetical protein
LLALAHNPGMDDAVEYLADSPPALSSTGKLMTICALAWFHPSSAEDLKTPVRGKLQYLSRPEEITDTLVIPLPEIDDYE